MILKSLNRKHIVGIIGIVIIISVSIAAVSFQSGSTTPTEITQSSTDYIVMRVYSTRGKIEGNASRPVQGDIEIYQYSHNAFVSGIVSGGMGASSIQHTPVTVVKLWDEASIPLWDIFRLGEHIPDVQVLFYQAGITDTLYFNVTLQDVQIVSMLTDSDAELTFEQVAFYYSRIYWIDELEGTWSGANVDGSVVPPPY